MPFIVFVVVLFYLFVVLHIGWPPVQKIGAAFIGALIGFYLPDMFVNNMIARRQQSIMRAFPDALDLMLICVESGMSIESAFTRVAWRRHAVSGTGRGTGADHRRTQLSARPPPGFRQYPPSAAAMPVCVPATALNQAEKYGTPWVLRCASPPPKTAKCACRRPNARPPRCPPSSPCR
jgi:tight adherence protein C